MSENDYIQEIFKEGYTVIPSLISDNTCDKLRQKLQEKYNSNKSFLTYNYFEGHNQIHLPNDYENFPEEILLNEKIHDIIGNIFGKNYYLYSYSCNANCAKVNQPYHMDCSHFHSIETIKGFGSP